MILVDGHVKMAVSGATVMVVMEGWYRCVKVGGDVVVVVNKLVKKKGIRKCVIMQTSANGPCSHCFALKYLTFPFFHSISFSLYYI